MGKYASCEKLAINKLMGVKEEKVIRGHSLLGLAVLTLRCPLRNTQTNKPYERKKEYLMIRGISSCCRIAQLLTKTEEYGEE